jgi:hypothetical protein
MESLYKTINVRFAGRWTKRDVNTRELDDAINIQSDDGWHFVSISLCTFLGYPQSALCVFKKEKPV